MACEPLPSPILYDRRVRWLHDVLVLQFANAHTGARRRVVSRHGKFSRFSRVVSRCRLVRSVLHHVDDQILGGIMQIPKDAVLLRIFIGESDRWEHQPLYEAIVMKARERHLAGATVLRGPMGFGAASRIHTAKILRLSMDLPIVIEIVDSEEKLNEFLPELEEMIGGGLVTLENIKVIHYR